MKGAAQALHEIPPDTPEQIALVAGHLMLSTALFLFDVTLKPYKCLAWIDDQVLFLSGGYGISKGEDH